MSRLPSGLAGHQGGARLAALEAGLRGPEVEASLLRPLAVAAPAAHLEDRQDVRLGRAGRRGQFAGAAGLVDPGANRVDLGLGQPRSAHRHLAGHDLGQHQAAVRVSGDDGGARLAALQDVGRSAQPEAPLRTLAMAGEAAPLKDREDAGLEARGQPYGWHAQQHAGGHDPHGHTHDPHLQPHGTCGAPQARSPHAAREPPKQLLIAETGGGRCGRTAIPLLRCTPSPPRRRPAGPSPDRVPRRRRRRPGGRLPDRAAAGREPRSSGRPDRIPRAS